MHAANLNGSRIWLHGLRLYAGQLVPGSSTLTTRLICGDSVLPRLGVRKHPRHVVMIRVGDQAGLAEPAFGRVALRGEDMAHLRMATLELARASLLEALRRTRMGLQLRHTDPS